MPPSSSSQAAAVGASVLNKQFVTAAEVLPRKMVIIGTYDPAITTIVDEVPALVTSIEESADTYGDGFMIHRLVKAAMLGSQNSETWVVPQAEAGGAVASAGDITITGPATAAGTIYLYIAGDLVEISVASGDAQNDIAIAVAAAITADPDLPVTAVVNGGTLNQVDVTAKSKGPWGDSINMSLNWGFQEALPAGVAVVFTQLTGGSGVPTLDDALTGMGTGDAANERHFTDLVHGYLQDSTSLNALSTYNGAGNTATGCYAKTVARPLRSLVGDVAAGSSGLTNLQTLADGRKTDRTSGVIAVPGSPNHPAEVAAQALGIAQRLNANRAEETVIGQILQNVIPGALADQWTKSYASRDTAVQGGISPTKSLNGVVRAQNLLTFYRPATVPASSNGYKSQRNISIIQNMLFNLKSNFEQDRWLGCSIVDDVARVTNIVDRQKARDSEAVKDDLIALAKSFLSKAWVYEVDTYTIPNISVQIRTGTNGFDTILPVILSGELGIIDSVIEFDTAITVLL